MVPKKEMTLDSFSIINAHIQAKMDNVKKIKDTTDHSGVGKSYHMNEISTYSNMYDNLVLTRVSGHAELTQGG